MVEGVDERRKMVWLRVDEASMRRLLATLRGNEPRVAAWYLEHMDEKTNRVFATQQMLREDYDGFFESRGQRPPSRSEVTKALGVLGGRESGRLHPRSVGAPLLLREGTGVYVVNPTYAFAGTDRAGRRIYERFTLVARERGVRDACGGWSANRWLKAGRDQLVELLASLRRREGQVAGELLRIMDRDNRVRTTQLAVADAEGMPGRSATAEAWRLLRGSRTPDGRVLAPVYVAKERYGVYMLNPAFFFKGTDERGRELGAAFRRIQRETVDLGAAPGD
ncbi:MAG: hypothetical protein Q4A01_04230 [Coriobacteriales bacterium]|nr:hypothetical protein [Coriobacteriales bacterium]